MTQETWKVTVAEAETKGQLVCVKCLIKEIRANATLSPRLLKTNKAITIYYGQAFCGNCLSEALTRPRDKLLDE